MVWLAEVHGITGVGRCDREVGITGGGGHSFLSTGG